jgi:hypothetical protein
MKRPMAIDNPESICYKCLASCDDRILHIIHIPAMGWGSSFDGWSTQINLCDECMQETNSDWWKLKEIKSEHPYGGSYYEYEDEILQFIESLPIEGQELFHNRFSTDGYYMEPQDWIDYELGILPHEKCKEYGMYSPQEKQAYQERFPVCDKVRIVVYNDDSRGSQCPFGAFGNKDGTAEGHQTQTGCYECMAFQQRQNDDIPVVDELDFEIHKLETKLGLLKSLKETNT